MRYSPIEWTYHTFNPWWGCVHASPACDHCYAEAIARWRGHNVWGKNAERRFFGDQHWHNPVKWNRAAAAAGERHRVFCGSMCDVMERRDDLPEIQQARHRLFDLIEVTPSLDWLLLTKRPHEYKKFLPSAWLKSPRHNVWLMTTCESQEYVWRVEEITRVPAVVHGISCEPMLSSLSLPKEFLELGSSAWVIAGGESGTRARATDPAWFRHLRDDCVAAGVPFHFKQWGVWRDLVRIGKKEAGRVLDGRVWDELPVPHVLVGR